MLALAREDADARVRRAAVKRLSEVAVLAEIAASDADPGVREEAEAASCTSRSTSRDEAGGEGGGARACARRAPRGGGEGRRARRHRARPRSARSPTRSPSPSVVRESEDTPTRLLALGRIEDGATLLGLALKLEQKAVAVAAVDRIADPDALKAVADKAKASAAARRARARLETGEPADRPRPRPLPPRPRRRGGRAARLRGGPRGPRARGPGARGGGPGPHRPRGVPRGR